MATTTKRAASDGKPKYKVGDYVTSPKHVFLEIVGVIDQGVLPIYAIRNPKNMSQIRWESQYELDEQNLEKGTPDFAKFAAVQAGDVLKMGFTDDRQYLRILARVGDVVMLSAAPDPKTVKDVTDLSKQLEELTDGVVNPLEMMGKADKDMLRKMASTTHASKVATDWVHVRHLALYNWQLIGE